MPDMPSDTFRESRNGKIVTFYSYKGGTGRTMALANVAWILAANGRRVLAADWDLESPGLRRFFQPFLGPEVHEVEGIIDMIRGYEWEATRVPEKERISRLIPERARVELYAFSLKWDHFPAGGCLDLLSPGRQNSDYKETLGALDWDNFHENLNGGQFLDAIRADMKRLYDYVLIDSRTGLSDISSICTVHLPDVLVDCFTLSTQGIEGAADVARYIEEVYKDRGIRILPVPMRVDPGEKDKVEAGHAVAVQRFDGFPADMSEAERRDYWSAVEVPYRAFYAYEETLAVFGDPPGSPTSLLSSFERMAAHISEGDVTGLPPIDEQLRNRTKQLFVRRPRLISNQIVVEFSPEDLVWGEWIAGVLREIGATVYERRLGQPDTPEVEGLASARTLAVVSAAYVTRYRAQPTPPTRPDLFVYVTTNRPLAEFPPLASAFLARIPEAEAIDRLHRLLGIADRPGVENVSIPATRYPGNEPKINRVPARNARFTGREEDLRRLREALHEYGTAVVVPVALQGLGGVGKTQVALEYVHRFMSDYDLVWWVACEQPQFIDASLADLGEGMQNSFGINAPPAADAIEASRVVLRLLSERQGAQRWLLVFDNADDVEAVRPYLPSGGGHVLITSRNSAWSGQQFRSLPIEVFTRDESVAHLRQRVPSITADEADKVADLLGDLPLAVATAGAWLAETSFTVSDYLEELKRQAPRALSISQLKDYPTPVSQTWDLSLNQLRKHSPAAARLLELCSVMAPRIATDLLHSETMARVLAPYDPALPKTMITARLVQDINRLALIKLDLSAKRVHVHRLVQAVVQDRIREVPPESRSADQSENEKQADEQIAAARRDVHQVLAAARPLGDVDDPGTWSAFRLIWPHLGPSQAMTSLDESVQQLFIDRVRYIWQRHDLALGREEAEEVARTWEAMLAAGPEPTAAKSLRRQLLHLRFNLANILRDQGNLEEARALDEAVLGEQRRFLGDDDPHMLMTAGSLGADLKALGRYRDALESDEQTYRAWLNLYGEDHPRTLAAANNLALARLLNGDFTRALQIDGETYERRRNTLGPTHPRTLDSAIRVARDLLEAGRYTEAADRMLVTWQSSVTTAELGPDSLTALNARMLLAIALRCSGQRAEAEDHFAVTSENLIRRFGDESNEALACRLSHAVNLIAAARPHDAETEIQRVLDVYEQRLGPLHPNTLVCLVDLANALSARGQRDRALQTSQTAVEQLSEVLGEDHPSTLAAKMVLGALLADQGDLNQAEEVEADVTARSDETLGRDHPDTLRCRANLLLTRHRLGVQGAAADLDQTIDQMARLIGQDHPDVTTLRGERRIIRALDPHPF